ncbi:MAG: hypothetical protein MZV64_29100 [Ignavibacteriales bacterium]|nr:hypothetical protein [Ignavibacteriales bacterium]
MRPLGFDWRLSVSILIGSGSQRGCCEYLGVISTRLSNTNGGNSLVAKIQYAEELMQEKHVFDTAGSVLVHALYTHIFSHV